MVKSTRLVYRYTCKCLFGKREKVRVCCAVCIWDVSVTCKLHKGVTAKDNQTPRWGKG